MCISETTFSLIHKMRFFFLTETAHNDQIIRKRFWNSRERAAMLPPPLCILKCFAYIIIDVICKFSNIRVYRPSFDANGAGVLIVTRYKAESTVHRNEDRLRKHLKAESYTSYHVDYEAILHTSSTLGFQYIIYFSKHEHTLSVFVYRTHEHSNI